LATNILLNHVSYKFYKRNLVWNFARNITGDGSRWSELGVCEVDAKSIHVGDGFDITGLFSSDFLDGIFSDQTKNSNAKFGNPTVGLGKAFEYLSYAEIASLGSLFMGSGYLAIAGGTVQGLVIVGGTTAGIVGGGFFIVVGAGLVLISIDLLEGNGLDFFGLRK